MKRMKWNLLFIGLLASISSVSAYADRDGGFHHGHNRGHIGVFIGAPLFWPWYYPPSYYPSYYPYYYPPAVVVPSAPPTYIEQGEVQAAPAPQTQFWYYCANGRAYYPYVKDCPAGWQQVPAQPPRS